MSAVANVYVVTKRGMYRHEIIGVYTTLNLAIQVGHNFVEQESDHYHSAEIVLATPDGETEYLGEVTAEWGPPDPRGQQFRPAFLGTKWTGQ